MKYYDIGTILKHKCCNIKYKIIKYDNNIFGEWVYLKCLFKSSFTEYGKIACFDISILKEYKPI